MAGQKPRQGWIYMVNPYRVSRQCKNGHLHIYDLDAPGEIDCKTAACQLTLNSSRVFRGTHPHLIWTGDQFQATSGYIQTFTAIPLTSKETFAGLPTCYPISKTAKNGLDLKSYALIHQICTIDGNCFKDSEGNWLIRIGQLGQKDKTEIERRLKYFLSFQDTPDEDWFRKNATPELVKKIYGYLPETDQQSLLEDLLEEI